MKKILIFLSITIVFGEKFNSELITRGKRDNFYRAWIYFYDKVGSEMCNISQKAKDRRAKSDVQSNHLWYDLEVSQIYINDILELGITIENESRWLNAVSVVCKMSDIEKISKLKSVKKIEPVIGYKKSKIEYAEDSLSNSRDFDYGNALAQIEQINVHELHNAGYTGEGVIILVMDTGFDLTHNAMANINVIAQWDVINNDSETANETSVETSNSQDHHGSKVLSTIAAYAPGEFIGVAFDAEFLLAKTEDVTQEVQQEEDDYVAGLEWGEAQGADVVSSSLAYLDWYTYEDMDGNTAVTTNAIDIASGLGLVCVNSAANEGNATWYYIAAPADADSVISVGAVNLYGEIASWSSHGPTFDGRIKPEVCARGVNTWCINPNSTTLYSQASGTSLACPLVGGAVALIIQAQPDWSAMEVREAVMMTASQSSNPDNSYGYGIMNAADAVEYEATVAIDRPDDLPSEFHVTNAYPNPFNPSLTIEVSGAVGEYLTVDIFSLTGKSITNVYTGTVFQPNQKMIWSPENIPNGIYVIRSILKGQSQFQKVTYLK
jgi:subtilisin family serine protease